MEENRQRDAQEDSVEVEGAVAEVFAQYQKKEKRKVRIIGDIIDFILGFFQ